MSETLLQISIDDVIPDPTQPRKTFVKEEVERLAASLVARGFLQPLRVLRDKERQCWRIVVGETRWRAARLAGMTQVPCIVVEGQPSEADLLADRLVENHCRNDLRPLELARGIATLKSLRRCSSQDVAAQLGISGASVTRAESLLTLPEEVQAMVDDGRLAESAAHEISRLKDDDAMRDLANHIVALRLNRDQAIELCRRKSAGDKATPVKAGRVSGKLEGVSFSFSFAGPLTPETLLKAVEQIRARLKELQKGNHPDASALAEMLRAS
jgi:ParB family transcriptional regulator, chromosome partitioning protein